MMDKLISKIILLKVKDLNAAFGRRRTPQYTKTNAYLA